MAGRKKINETKILHKTAWDLYRTSAVRAVLEAKLRGRRRFKYPCDVLWTKATSNYRADGVIVTCDCDFEASWMFILIARTLTRTF